MAKRKSSGAKRSKRKPTPMPNEPVGENTPGTTSDGREESLNFVEDAIPYVPEMDAFANDLFEPLGKLYSALKDALRCARYIQNHLQMFYPPPLDRMPDEEFVNALGNPTARDKPRPDWVEWYDRDKWHIIRALDYIDYIVDKYSLSERLLIEAHEKAQERADHKLVMSYYGYAHTTAFGAALRFCNEMQVASVEEYSPQIPTRDLQEDWRLDADLKLLFRMLDKLIDKTAESQVPPRADARDIPDNHYGVIHSLKVTRNGNGWAICANGEKRPCCEPQQALIFGNLLEAGAYDGKFVTRKKFYASTEPHNKDDLPKYIGNLDQRLKDLAPVIRRLIVNPRRGQWGIDENVKVRKIGDDFRITM